MQNKPTPEKTAEEKRDELLKQIVAAHSVSPERAQEILDVMTARNVSPTTAIEILDSAAWHEEVRAGRAAPNQVTEPPAPPADPANN
jgi:hypothetical protein